MTAPMRPSPDQIAMRPPVPHDPQAQSPERSRSQSLALAGGAPVPAEPEPLLPPLPPIEEVRGKEYPAAEAGDGAKLEFLKRMGSDTDPGFVARAKTMAYHLLLSAGKQHVAWSNRSRRFEELPLEANELRVVVNFIRPILRARTNRVLPTRLDWQIIPDSNDYDARDVADVGERWLDNMTTRTNLLVKTDTALELAYCGGVAFLKHYWNGAIGEAKPATAMQVELVPTPVVNPETGEPLVNPETGEPLTQQQPTPIERYVNAQGQMVATPEEAHWFRSGDTDITVRSLFNIRWNADAHGFSPAEGLRYLVDEDHVPLEVARERYADYAKKITADGNTSALGTYQQLARDANLRTPDRTASASGSSRTEGQSVRVLEYWELPTRYFPMGRCMVMVGNCMVYDGDFPDGVLPYVPIYDEPTPLSPGGRGVVYDLVGPQQIINEQWASLIASSRMAGLGQFVTFNFPGMPELITQQHGAILRLPMRLMKSGKSPADLLKPLVHPPIPGDRFEIITLAREAMYQLGAFHEVTRGQTPPGVTSGVAVRALSEREDGMLKRAVNALRSSLTECGRVQLAIARAKDDPDSTRWLPSDRPDLGYQIEQVSGAKLPDPERILLTLEGFKPRSEEELRADTMEALQMGLISPQTALKVFDLGRGVRSVYQSEQRQYARARSINLAIERGRVQPDVMKDPNGTPILDPETGEPLLQAMWLPMENSQEPEPVVLEQDDHVLHFTVLEELILDISKPKQTRDIASAIYMERQQLLQMGAAPPTKPDSDPASGNDPGAAALQAG